MEDAREDPKQNAFPKVLEHNQTKKVNSSRHPFFHPYLLGCLTGTRRSRLRKKSTFDALRHVAVSHDPWFIHRIARDLRQHSVRRDETVLDGGDNLILVRTVLEL